MLNNGRSWESKRICSGSELLPDGNVGLPKLEVGDDSLLHIIIVGSGAVACSRPAKDFHVLTVGSGRLFLHMDGLEEIIKGYVELWRNQTSMRV